MEEKDISREESWRLIQSMIRLAKTKLVLSGFHFLLWGIIVLLTSLVNYYLITIGYGNESFWIWAVASALGILLALGYEYRRRQTYSTRTHFDKLYTYLWIGFGITIFLIILIAVSLQLSPTPFILALVGLATFVSGVTYSFAPLVGGAVVFWLAALASSFVEMPDQLLVNALAIFLGYIIPGILLWRKSVSVNNV